MSSKVKIMKIADGRYKLFRNSKPVATVIFEKKYYPAPALRNGFEMTIDIKDGPTLKEVCRSITYGLNEAKKKV